jgi:hypothetical protein
MYLMLPGAKLLYIRSESPITRHDNRPIHHDIQLSSIYLQLYKTSIE